MHWVLIVLVWSQYGTAVTTQEFDSRHDCQAAATWVEQQAVGYVKAECFRK